MVLQEVPQGTFYCEQNAIVLTGGTQDLLQFFSK